MFFYKDFNKTAKDCCDAGSPLEFSYKFKSSNADGCKFEASQTKRTAATGDRGPDHFVTQGQFSTFVFKNAKGGVFNELGIQSNNGDKYEAYHKWSHGGLIPDVKIKAQIDHGWESTSQLSPNGAFGIMPTKVKVSAEYTNGPIKAGGSLDTADTLTSDKQTTAYSADFVFNAGDINVGAMVKGKHGAPADTKVDYNLAAKYSMGDFTGVFQTEEKLRDLNFNVHNRCNDRFQVAVMSKFNREAKSLTTTAGAQMSIDGSSNAAFSLDCGNLMDFKAEAAKLTAAYKNSNSYGKFGLSAQLSLGALGLPVWGFNFETN